jgi:hypothetical protein
MNFGIKAWFLICFFFNSTEVDARRPGKFGAAWSRMNGTTPKKTKP